ncbi:MAG: 16S rRNA (guanine(966)-N(2))-methyltransferase RsmD [Labilithrix sp.]|nr:16S rRNA (guanine(966)-N(2))-methyltransferase RsmD [Labilithrix sp.]MCW5831085.1 16S rRNA (guanine(966)-N(2))-methyltransferase RsmD [Labilithrix sp.]
MRITGGVFRSRALTAPRGQETRPTSDRVREALFSMLASDGVFAAELGPRVLDLYAGSGALGLEAISRGARSAVLVESARPALAAIRENVRALGVEREVRVLAARVERALDAVEGPFDLALVDPPYADVRTPSFGAILAEVAARLAPSGVLVLEHASADEPPPAAGLTLDRRRRHGDTTLSLFRRSEPSERPEPSAGDDGDAGRADDAAHE